RLIARERLAQQREGLTVLRLGQRTQPARVELPLTASAAKQDRRDLAQRRTQRGAHRRDRADRACQLALARPPALERGVNLFFEANAHRLVEQVGPREGGPVRRAAALPGLRERSIGSAAP